MTLEAMATGIADRLSRIFCQSGRDERNATANPAAKNKISERIPEHASATLSTRTVAPSGEVK